MLLFNFLEINVFNYLNPKSSPLMLMQCLKYNKKEYQLKKKKLMRDELSLFSRLFRLQPECHKTYNCQQDGRYIKYEYH